MENDYLTKLLISIGFLVITFGFINPNHIRAFDPNCQNNATYSNPGPNNSCCWGGIEYLSGQLHSDKTFACVDGQWLYSGHLGNNSPVTWAHNTSLCQSYGPYSSSSTGWYGPYAYQNKDFSSRDKYLMYGDSTNTYCGENKFCDSSKNCIPCSRPEDPCAAQTQAKKQVFSFYFYWYDAGINDQAYKICGTTYNTAFGYRACSSPLASSCSKLSVLEQTPIFGENSYIHWQNRDLYKADFIRMSKSGIDVAILVGDPRQEFDTAALPIINKSLLELKNEGHQSPKLALFEAMDNWYDVNNPLEVKKLYSNLELNLLTEKIANRVTNIWNNLDIQFTYIHEGKKVLWLFRPPEIYNAELNCRFASNLKSRLLEKGNNIFLVAPSSFGNCKSIDAYHNWGQGNVSFENQSLAAAPAKFISDKLDICEVTPGLERNNAKYCSGDYATFKEFPTLPRSNGEHFIKSWDYCLQNNEGWIVVQTWNEYFESTNIAPSIQDGTKFTEINLAKSNQFKNKSDVWQECDIDAECFQSGMQKKCIQNKCLFVTKPGDLNGDGKVNIYDYSKLISGYGTLYTNTDFINILANYGK